MRHNSIDQNLANKVLLNLFIEKQNGSLTVLNTLNVQDEYLDGINSDATILNLIALLRDPEWNVRKSAVIDLTTLGPEAEPAIPALIEALSDEEWHVRKPAVEALAAIAPEDPDVLKALQASLDDPEDQMRQAAARAMEVIEALTPVFRRSAL